MAEAVVTMFTATRMAEIEARAVVEGHVVGDNLVLTRNDGTLIDAGNVRGPVGDTQSVSADFTFTVASTVWTCTHGFGSKAVDVTTVDNNDSQIFGDVEYIDENTLTISWFYPTTGTATLQR